MTEECKVLVVDDDLGILGTVVDVLALEGIPSCSTSEAGTVIGLLRQAPIRVVVSDINMPDVDGLALLAQIKALEAEQKRSIAVIILTGAGAEDKAECAVAQGAFRYLPKPFDIDEFVRCVRDALASTGG
jgi:DNA-binding NtrC family response regulator